MNSELKQLLLAYINKSASAEQIAWVKNWIAASSSNESAFIQLYEKYHKNLSSKHQNINNEAAFERFIRENSTVRKNNNLPTFIKYAAIFILICSVGLIIYQTSNTKNKLERIVVAKGNKNKLTLPTKIIYKMQKNYPFFETNFTSFLRSVFQQIQLKRQEKCIIK